MKFLQERPVDPNVAPTEDQLGWTMKTLRPAEAQHLGANETSIGRLPHADYTCY